MLALLFLLLMNSVEASPFRVLVFPHQGVYSAPQGKETVVSKVAVRSEEYCTQYIAELQTDQEWVKTGAPIAAAKTFDFSSSHLNRWSRFFHRIGDAFYFSCTKPFRVQRESKLESLSYEGDFVVIFNKSSATSPIQIINIIDPEKYIQGVVPSEVGTGWPAEALKSQAVAARTYAWWNVVNGRRSQLKAYDLDDTIGSQSYLGISRRAADTDAAVIDTSRLVMKYDGKVIKAYFSADSGGRTESEKNVFGENLPYCQSKDELYDLSKTKTEWEKKIPFSEINATYSANIKSIDVSAADRNESGRVDDVTLNAVNGKIIKVPGPLFRRNLKLRSTLFQVSTVIENGQRYLLLTGKGYGHGVGMAQIGAKEYATQLGWTFDQILKFYYTGVTLESINDEYSE